MLRYLTKSQILKLSLTFVFISIFTIIFFTPQKVLINDFVIWVQQVGVLGQFIFAIIYVLSTILVMPGMPLALGAGFIYGWFQGLLIIVPASITGGIISFLIGRYLSQGKAHKFIKKIPYFNAINAGIEQNGFFLVFLLFAYPLTPFRMLNYALSITKLGFIPFAWALSFSMVPHLIPYVYLGSLLSSYEQILDGTFYKLISQKPIAYFGGIFSTVLFLLILFFMLRKFIKTY